MISEKLLSIRTVQDLISSAASAYAGNTAICVKSESGVIKIEYQDFFREVQKLAAVIADQFGIGKIVALPGKLSKEWLFLFLAVLYSGNIAAPVDFSVDVEELKQKFEELKPDAIFTDAKCVAVSKKLISIFPNIVNETVEEWYNKAKQQEKNIDSIDFCSIQKPDDTAVLIYTSGTTGNNKIVELTHRNVCADALLSVTYLDCAHGISDKVLSALPVCHMYGITAPIFGSLFRGFTLCIGGGAWTLRKDMQIFQPSILLAVPEIIHNFSKKFLPTNSAEKIKNTDAVVEFAEKLFGGNLKTIITGGAPLDGDYSGLFSELGIFLMNGYGITECSPIVSCDVKTKHKDGAIGKAGILPEICTVRIIDGEICVKGEIVSPGYWEKPELNEEAYTDGWFHTGDLGFLDEEGYLFITGRKKNILILPNGNNISLDEMERQLERCPEADDAILLGKVEKGNAYIEAIIYSNSKNERSLEETKRAVGTWINEMNRSNPRYKRIADFTVTEVPFERTSLGKIKKYKYS